MLCSCLLTFVAAAAAGLEREASTGSRAPDQGLSSLCEPGEPRGAGSRDESAPLWMLSRAPRGAEATAPGRHRCLLMTVLGMLFSHCSRRASGGEAAPLSSGDS